MKRKVFMPGIPGSFHHQAAMSFFESVGSNMDYISCNSPDEVLKKTRGNSKNSLCVLAVENSIAGNIMNNYSILRNSPLNITGEILLPVRLHLLAEDQVKIDDIAEIHSHPVAMMQCSVFLNKYPNWARVESRDTAESAKFIKTKKSSDKAAIAGELAAKLYGLSILKKNIHTVKTNYTRFFILEPIGGFVPDALADKATVYFEVGDRAHQLNRILDRISENGFSLTKLLTTMIPGSTWRIGLYIDMEFNNGLELQDTIDFLETNTLNFKLMGKYKSEKHMKH